MNGIKRLGLDKINGLGLNNNRADNFQKTLSIKFISASVDDKNYNLVFEVSQNNLKKFDATIFVEEVNATKETVVPKTKITLSKSPATRVNAWFSRDTVFYKYFWKSGTLYQATITCDGVSASTVDFRLSDFLIKAPETAAMSNGKCLCKKNIFTADDVRKIVIGLRKGEVTVVNGTWVRDISGNGIYLDDKGDAIPNDAQGKPTVKSKKRKMVDLTEYSSPISTKTPDKLIQDNLFYMIDSKENIPASEVNYETFTKWLNYAITELNLTTCIKKIHFLAQIYHETQRFANSYENSDRVYGGGTFYQGRGFIQLTHDYNYKDYYKSIYGVNPEEEILKKFVPTLANSMEMAMKSAVWYWKKGNINKHAEKDDLVRVCAAVNYPALSDNSKINENNINGFKERKRYYLILKTFFDYENCK